MNPRPFLKWAGGKTQLTDTLIARKPASFHTYHEPFVGGGALFFRLYRDHGVRRAILSDINPELIDTYVAIRDHVSEVIALLAAFPYSRAFYYEIREQDPWALSLPERAARMIYLNKTGYNGLYRVNRQGKFNVPFGNYRTPTYLDRENLLAVSHALQDIDIRCCSFETVIERSQPGDWVYFDPPYIPISATASFTAYTPHGFGLYEQKRLRNGCQQLGQRKVSVMLSNSNTPIVRSLYQGYWMEVVLANRAINCNGADRGKIAELVITNYPRQ